MLRKPALTPLQASTLWYGNEYRKIVDELGYLDPGPQFDGTTAADYR